MDQNFEKFDVVIIGASLSGNYLASLLSTKLTVAVIEEHNEIGLPFQCAGIVSQKLNELIDLPKNIILNRVDTAKIVAPSGKFVKLRGDEKPYIIDRIALDRLFYERAKENNNTTYFLGEKFKSLEYIKNEKHKWVLITTSKRKLVAKMLIGSDGPLSLVANSFGIKNELIYAMQIRIKSKFDQN
ncbi:MAG: FAD-dependent monooxygenase, partial [Promethearchaeota archaeon]